MKKMVIRSLFVFLSFALFVFADEPEFTGLEVYSSPCDADGMVMLDVDVYVTNAVPGQTIDVNVGLLNSGFLRDIAYTGTPTRVTVAHPGSGQTWVRAYLSRGDERIERIDQPIPLCPGECAIRGIELLGFEDCNEYGYSEAILEVNVDNVPTNAMMDIRALGEYLTNIDVAIQPGANIVRLPVYARGQNFAVMAAFPEVDCAFRKDFQLAVPVCSPPTIIEQARVIPIGPCSSNGMRLVQIEVDVNPPWPGAEITIGDDRQIAVSGPMTYTNLIDARSVSPQGSLTARVSWPPIEIFGVYWEAYRALEGELTFSGTDVASIPLPGDVLCRPCGPDEVSPDCYEPPPVVEPPEPLPPSYPTEDTVFTRMEVASSACDADGMVMLDVDLYVTNAVTNMRVDVYVGLNVSAENVAYTGTPTRVTLQVPGTGRTWIRAYIDNSSSSERIEFIDHPIPSCPGVCSITSVNLLGFDPCDEYGYSSAILEVNVDNVPTNELLDVRSLNGPWTKVDVAVQSGATIVRLPVLARGQDLHIIASFAESDCMFRKEFQVAVPSCDRPPLFEDVTITPIGPCLSNGKRAMLVDLNVNPPWPNAMLRVGDDMQSAVAGRMSFTNIVKASLSVSLMELPEELIYFAAYRELSEANALSSGIHIPAEFLCRPCADGEDSPDCYGGNDGNGSPDRPSFTGFRFKADGNMGNPGSKSEMFLHIPAGERYVLESTDDLQSPSWTMEQDFPGSGSSIDILEDVQMRNPNSEVRYFRLRLPE